MPAYIVKDKPDEDFYVMWSSVVDAPTFCGTRAEMEQCRWFGPGDVASERFARADKYGTSAQWGADRPGAEIVRPYGWSDTEGFIYQQQGWLRRARLRELCVRLGREEPVDDLLEPLEED